MSAHLLDTVIVGGGLCGLALANSLHRQGRAFALYEARARLGGRILSVSGARDGMALDLGPTWFWPDTQPRMSKLLADLDLKFFAQHDNGSVLHLTDHDKRPATIRVATCMEARNALLAAWELWWKRLPIICLPMQFTWSKH